MRRTISGDVAAPSPAGAAVPGEVPAISLRGLEKRYPGPGGGAPAVAGVDLDIAEGEFVTLLGPSGSGKTTVLRMIAGFEAPTGGRVLLRGRDVTDVPPFARDVNTVFQDYALFPHLDVRRNVEYGLRVAGVPARERRQRALEALAAVRLEGLEGRRPAALSGGQRQRVALARALVNRPAVLLLDEPLGALDLKLREQMQVELKGIQRRAGITFVFVTHDQEEALTMSDRVVVFAEGRVEQVGTPVEVYEHPGSVFVAGFVGTSNVIAGDSARELLGRAGTWSIRPEKLRLRAPDDAPQDPGTGSAGGVVTEVSYTGPGTRVVVALDAGGVLTAVEANTGAPLAQRPDLRGARVRLVWDRAHEVAVGTHQTTT